MGAKTLFSCWFFFSFFSLSRGQYAPLASGDVSPNSTLCFVQRCNGNFTIQKPIQVSIGGYINVLNAIRTSENGASASGVVWVSWPICTAYYDNTGQLKIYRPGMSLAVHNLFTNDNFVYTNQYAEPVCSFRPGMAYQRFMWSANFKQVYDFHSFPLDSHTVSFEFVDAVYDMSFLHYVPESVNNSVLSTLSVTGWTVLNRSTVVSQVPYPSVDNPDLLVNHATFALQITVSRGSLVYGFRMLPPILVTLFSSVVILVLRLRDMNTRIGIAVGGLLTIVFIQFSFAWAVPANLAYLTRLDWILLTCYLAIFLVVVECFIMYFFARRCWKQLDRLHPKKDDDTVEMQWTTSQVFAEKRKVSDMRAHLHRKLDHIRWIDISILIALIVATSLTFILLSALPCC